MRSDSGLAPAGSVALGIALLSVLDAMMKVLATEHGTPAAVLMRYAGGATWAIVFFFGFRGVWPSLRSVRANALRAVVGVATALSFFYAITHLPLVEAIALTFTSPIFLALLGRIILKEPVGPRVVLGIALGFAGVLVILAGRLGPGAEAARSLDGIAAALVSAVLYAFSMVLLRQQTAHDSILTLVFVQNISTFVLSIPIGLSAWSPPSRADMLLAFIVGLFGTTGHLAMAWGYARAEAARLGVLEYTNFIWATLLGWAIFSEVPTPLVLVGAALITGGAAIASRPRRAAAPALPEEAV